VLLCMKGDGKQDLKRANDGLVLLGSCEGWMVAVATGFTFREGGRG
jgi:hypothetical protein